MGQSPGDPGPKIGVTKDAGLPWAHSESINISKSQTPMFNLLDYLYFHLASVEITDPWGEHSGTSRGHGLPILGAAAVVDPFRHDM